MVASQAQVVIGEKSKIWDIPNTWGDNLLLIRLLKLLKYFLSPTHKLGPALCFAAGPAGEGLVEEKAKGQQLDKHWICGWRFFFTFLLKFGRKFWKSGVMKREWCAMYSGIQFCSFVGWRISESFYSLKSPIKGVCGLSNFVPAEM